MSGATESWFLNSWQGKLFGLVYKFRSLPFEEAGNPMAIQKATLSGDIKFLRENFDQTTRELLSKIFVQEPNLRASIEKIKMSKFFLTLAQ